MRANLSDSVILERTLYCRASCKSTVLPERRKLADSNKCHVLPLARKATKFGLQTPRPGAVGPVYLRIIPLFRSCRAQTPIITPFFDTTRVDIHAYLHRRYDSGGPRTLQGPHIRSSHMTYQRTEAKSTSSNTHRSTLTVHVSHFNRRRASAHLCRALAGP